MYWAGQRCEAKMNFPAEHFKLKLGNALFYNIANHMPASWSGAYHSTSLDEELNKRKQNKGFNHFYYIIWYMVCVDTNYYEMKRVLN